MFIVQKISSILIIWNSRIYHTSSSQHPPPQPHQRITFTISANEWGGFYRAGCTACARAIETWRKLTLHQKTYARVDRPMCGAADGYGFSDVITRVARYSRSMRAVGPIDKYAPGAKNMCVGDIRANSNFECVAHECTHQHKSTKYALSTQK